MTRSTTRPRARVSASAAAIATLLLGGTVLTGCSTSSSAAQSSSSSPGSPSSSTPTGSVAYDEPVLKVTGAYIRQPVTADMAAGYFTLTNTGRQPDKLTGVTSDIAAMVTMHRTTAENQMVPVKAFTIPAGGTLTLRTGGNHLMFMGLKKKPTAGETVTLHLRFAASDAITVRVPVKPTTYQPPN
ncbi:copper chaperone PCu(A)C [Streptomyces pluripotens]|uniref:Copper chaperone PCu(A)C n=1 Tax=Streptomyces pluripotens TaxID=1355015 RepID=A0A221P619_9ACTN|nr:MULTISPECIES: copper chaperone PCu(A)C [Streptomyces]ARP73407.1 hypothetical protein LK06_029360 [Streptomyces pluripotens]ASN27657.1 copper chaperone PCu(A)C [Streptomyces pluripotens]KIE24977.1 lipoprotein [Streptomyces sp. MUSC 125]MCH0561110.1 copper chaperone PCu(A)C [Streptomyces sp. MUM 16J]